MPQPFGQQAQQMISPGQAQADYAPGLGATGPLFAQQGGMGGGINEQQLAQILRLLGYGG
jgi:hypothetical protein